jgi:hypothetical protein
MAVHSRDGLVRVKRAVGMSTLDRCGGSSTA